MYRAGVVKRSIKAGGVRWGLNYRKSTGVPSLFNLGLCAVTKPTLVRRKNLGVFGQLVPLGFLSVVVSVFGFLPKPIKYFV